jgi:hypothetical protein
MRDIRGDLQQRLDALKAQRDELQRQLAEKMAEIDEYEKVVSAALAFEERMTPKALNLGAPKANRGPVTEQSRPAFEKDILNILPSDGGEMNHLEIKAELSKLGWAPPKDGGSLGRTVHGTLLSMKNRGLLAWVSEGVWKRGPKADAA